jgi:hypothetical protein
MVEVWVVLVVGIVVAELGGLIQRITGREGDEDLMGLEVGEAQSPGALMLWHMLMGSFIRRTLWMIQRLVL